jgi:thiol-disulfide isomerase/thioredoxin
VSSGAYVLLAAVTLAVAFGIYRAVTDGRFRGTHRVRGAASSETAPVEARIEAPSDAPARAVSVLDGTPWSGALGERATFVQFSSAFCAPCRATRRVLEDVVAGTPGVSHVEIDAEHHLELVRRLGVLRTPTTLVLDGAGAEVTRASGAPTKAQVQAALAALAR